MSASYWDIVMRHFRSGRSISTLEAFKIYGITCIGQRIGELRRGDSCTGYPRQEIGEKWEKVIGQNGKVKKYKRFWLIQNEKNENAETTN